MDDHVTMGAATLDPAAEATDWVLRRGKVFECGEYQDKAFSLTPEEAQAAVTAFAPVPLDLEHVPSVLDGKLGHLEHVEMGDDGRSLVGRLSEARWLSDVLGEVPRKVSLTWDRATKRIVGCALVNTPRVPDAAMMSAYAAFAAARHDTPPGQVALQMIHDHAAASGAVCAKPGGKAKMSSKHEAATIQTIHDMTTQHGAQCQAIGEGMAAHVPTMFSTAKGTSMKLFDWLTQQAKEQGVEIEDTPAVFNAQPAAPDPRVAELENANKALAADMARFKAERIEAEAVAEAERVVLAHKALPAEREAIIAAFRQAATDDAAHGTVSFSAADGTPATTSRVAQLRALYDARPAHGLTAEQITASAEFGLANQAQTNADEAAKKKAEFDRLMGLTPLGQAALKNSKG